MTNKNKEFVITKKIAKHGNQAIIVIPRILEDALKPRTIARILYRKRGLILRRPYFLLCKLI